MSINICSDAGVKSAIRFIIFFSPKMQQEHHDVRERDREGGGGGTSVNGNTTRTKTSAHALEQKSFVGKTPVSHNAGTIYICI